MFRHLPWKHSSSGCLQRLNNSRSSLSSDICPTHRVWCHLCLLNPLSLWLSNSIGKWCQGNVSLHKRHLVFSLYFMSSSWETAVITILIKSRDDILSVVSVSSIPGGQYSLNTFFRAYILYWKVLNLIFIWWCHISLIELFKLCSRVSFVILKKECYVPASNETSLRAIQLSTKIAQFSFVFLSFGNVFCKISSAGYNSCYLSSDPIGTILFHVQWCSNICRLLNMENNMCVVKCKHNLIHVCDVCYDI